MVEILCACILVSFCPVCARPCASNPFQSHHVLLTPIERERERNGLCIPFKQSPMPSLWIQSKAEVKPKTKSSKDSGRKAGQGAQMGNLKLLSWQDTPRFTAVQGFPFLSFRSRSTLAPKKLAQRWALFVQKRKDF